MGILDTLTETQYRTITQAHTTMVAAEKAAHQGFAPDWGKIAAWRNAEAAFEAACEGAGLHPGEVLAAL